MHASRTLGRLVAVLAMVVASTLVVVPLANATPKEDGGGALAGAVLLGLLLNAVMGWWWADPLAGLSSTE